MGLSDLERTEVVSSASAAESRRFGIKTSRLTIGRGALTNPDRALEDVQRELDATDGQLIIVRYPTEFAGLVRMLGGGPYSLYPSGSLVYWGLRSNESVTASHEVTGISVVDRQSGATLEEASSVIVDSFDQYTNHYSYNPRLDPHAVKDGYVEWAMNSLGAGANHLFVLRMNGLAAGVAVVSADSETWEIELAGMTRASQGKGLYPLLLQSVLNASREAASRTVISTQSHNVRVQRLWARIGMVPLDSYDTLHLSR